ncbi:MAG: Uma2 family endonuclease [Ferruginibacter sp.]|nr:Uma2 family endonuclease [Rhodoferax sp.]
MGLAQKSLAYIEPEDYLRMEEFSSEKHEYLDGVIYAWQGQTVRGMAGESIDHNRIMRNIGASLHAQAAPLGCEVFMADVRLRPFKNSAYFYPDVMVRCGPTASGEATEISDAALVVEVLSNTTEGFDRQDKFDRYRCMTSLQCYVLVSPMLRTIEVFRADQG